MAVVHTFSLFIFILPILLIAILFFVMWIIMLVDAATRKFKGESDKVVWVLIIVFLGLIGALVYYFVVYQKDDEKSIKWLWITLLVLVLIIIFFVFLIYLISAPIGM